MKKIIFCIVAVLMFVFPAGALQQTAGELVKNITVGNSTVMKYGLRNEENNSITVKFNVTGDVSEYIQYPKELVLEPNKFTYIELKTAIPDDYNGNNSLKGTIYALKEGAKGGQVQLNIRLGKNIKVNVIKPEVKETLSKMSEDNNIIAPTVEKTTKVNLFVVGIIAIIAIVLVAVAMTRISRNKVKEVENK